MKFTSLLLFGFLLTFNSSSNEEIGANRKKNPINVHIIAIGLDHNGIDAFPYLQNCVSDTQKIVEKIETDVLNVHKYHTNTSTTRGTRIQQKDSLKNKNKTKVFTHLLLNEQANLENIRNTFKKVISESTTNDYFYFFFAGMSLEVENDETILVTFNNNEKSKRSKVLEYKNYQYLGLNELANYMNQIPAKNQIVISEAGLGKTFAQNLQSNLFELDPDLALNSDRNRIILTTLGIGADTSKCSRNDGPLSYYILNSGNIFEVFHNYHYYEYLLNKTEVSCSPQDTKYYYISQENNYKKLLAKRYEQLSATRGSKAKKNPNLNTEENDIKESKTHALIIATNVYNENQQSWGNLKNPLNDASAVSELLEEKYGAEVTKVYNESKNNIRAAIFNLQSQLNPNDKLIVFMAGHGYFKNGLGYIVTSDSKDLNEDIYFDSYIPMSNISSLLDALPSKSIFTILDVCYGASFELYNADLPIQNYTNTTFDNGLDNFILETDKSYSRIMLASGEQEVFDYWKNNEKHSPFASKLIKALDNEDEFICPGKIYSYVLGNTTKPILKRFGKHETTGDFLLKVLN